MEIRRYKSNIDKIEVKFDKELLEKLFDAFPQSFVNPHNEFIIYPRENTYFLLGNIKNDDEVYCKVLEYVSRQATKGINRFSQRYHRDGLENFFGYHFSDSELNTIYCRLGNGVNRKLCSKFIKSNLDIKVLESDE